MRPVAIFGMLVVFVAAIVLTLLAATSSNDPPFEGDIRVARAVQSTMSGPVTTLAEIVNSLSSWRIVVPVSLFGILLLLEKSLNLEAALLIAATIARSSAGLLKELCQSDRPTAPSVCVIDGFEGYGFPSGHTLGAVVSFGVLFFLARRLIRERYLRLALLSFSALMILATGFSRIYVGAHWPSAVLGGYLWGALILVALLTAYDQLSADRVRGGAEHRAAADSVSKR